VAKDTLAVALSSGEEWSCTNDAGGIRRLVQRLNAAGPVLVGLEATGGYEGELLAALIAAGIEARRVNPREVRHFARAAGTAGENRPNRRSHAGALCRAHASLSAHTTRPRT
jgi:transposase